MRENRDGTRWFAPAVLAKVGAISAGFAVFESYFDNRELQGLRPQVALGTGAMFSATLDLGAETGGIWFNFGADTGDSIEATRLFAEAMTDGFGGIAPRFVVLGGDAVYPMAGTANYEERLCGPWADGANRDTIPPVALAIPGNHDYYDGLKAFLHVFAQGGTLGESATSLVQGRSYWTVRLPHGWWIWGADIEVGSEIDQTQLGYFTEAARAFQSGDQVILCVSKPFWYRDDAETQRKVAELEGLVQRSGAARVALMLTGDHHHYAHFVQETESSEDAQHRITSGGGGAFWHPTSTLPDHLQAHGVHSGDGTRRFRLQARFPTRAQSNRLSWRLLAFTTRNRSYGLIPAFVTLLFLLAAISTPQVRFGNGDHGLVSRSLSDAFRQLSRWQSSPTILSGSPAAIVLALGAWMLLVAFARPGAHQAKHRWGKWALGSVHAMLFLGAVTISIHLGASIGDLEVFGGSEGMVLASVLSTLVLAWFLGSIAMTIYLCLAWFPPWHWNGNEAFSAIRCNDVVHMVRFHLGASGTLTAHPVYHPSKKAPHSEAVERDVRQGISAPPPNLGRFEPIEAAFLVGRAGADLGDAP